MEIRAYLPGAKGYVLIKDGINYYRLNEGKIREKGKWNNLILLQALNLGWKKALISIKDLNDEKIEEI